MVDIFAVNRSTEWGEELTALSVCFENGDLHFFPLNVTTTKAITLTRTVALIIRSIASSRVVISIFLMFYVDLYKSGDHEDHGDNEDQSHDELVVFKWHIHAHAPLADRRLH